MQITFSTASSVMPRTGQPVAHARTAFRPQVSASPRFGFGGNFIKGLIKAAAYSAGVSIVADQIKKHGGSVVGKLAAPLTEGAKELKDNWEALKDNEKLSAKKGETPEKPEKEPEEE